MRIASRLAAVGPIAAALAALACADASAQAIARPYYVKVEAGAGWSSSDDLSSGSLASRFSDERTAAVAGLAVGYRYLPWLRSEISLSHLFPSDFAATGSNPADALRLEGRIKSWRAFASVLIDPVEAVAPGALGGVRPYLGGGVGLAANEFARASAVDQLAPNPRFHLDRNTTTRFAWHLSGGIAVDVGDFTLDVGYRYVDAGRVESSGQLYAAGGESLAIQPFRGDLRTHELTVGLAYRF